MKHVNAARIHSHFKVIAEGSSSQAAMMTLKPGQSSSEQPENEHPKAEQWVCIISGIGIARTKSRAIRVKQGSLVLIEKGEPHQIKNTGKMPLVTLNFYSPPAYTTEGEVKRSVKRQ
jgi:mannose-6-phosphate isomerase-like protein (cupin superfamily)